MDFKKGDIIRRPNGKYIFEVKSTGYKHRFGRFLIHNKNNGKTYFVMDLDRFEHYVHLAPLKNSKDLKFSFKDGV